MDPNCTNPQELESLSVRCVELHVYAPGGGLGDPKHFDGGSVVTVDLMLDDDFIGGKFQTHEKNEQRHPHDGTMSTEAVAGHGGGDATSTIKQYEFNKGDAIIFPSLKYHQVGEITQGCRKVLVLEFWNGVERHCDHRCHTPQGVCTHSRSDVPTFHPPPENCYYD